VGQDQDAGSVVVAADADVVRAPADAVGADAVVGVEPCLLGRLWGGRCRPWPGWRVRDTARGKTVLAPTVADSLVRFVRQPTSVTLSAREVEVLSQVAKAGTNADIGRPLHISDATMKTHLLRAFNKLGVSDRTAAVTTAMSLGLRN
jgi:DNA-binding CsgD family transcriptional regulator